jgi:hypothetical protein
VTAFDKLLISPVEGKIHMINIYRDSLTPKKSFFHFDILGLKFRLKTYPRESIKKYNVYADNQGYGLNFGKRNFKVYTA